MSELPENPEKENACEATPHKQLIEEILNPNIPKNEREHAACREIQNLQAKIIDQQALIEHLVHGCHSALSHTPIDSAARMICNSALTAAEKMKEG